MTKWAIAAAGLGFALSGCGAPRFELGDAEPLRLAITTTPTSLDPARSTTQVTADIARQQYETLVRLNDDGKLVGQLADWWRVTDGGLTYAFHLRPSTFSDGQPVTPSDVKASLERSCRADVGSSEVMLYLGDIEGADFLHRGYRLSIPAIEAKNHVDVVVIRLARRSPAFLAKLTHPCAAVVRETSGGLLGTGTYVLDDFVDGVRYRFKPNKYAREKANNAGLDFEVISDPATRMNIFRRGQLDICPLGLGDAAGVRSEPELAKTLTISPAASVAFLQLNPKAQAALQDINLRVSLSAAIDRERIVGQILQGIPTVANNLVPPGVAGHSETSMIPKASVGPMPAKPGLLKIYYGDKERLGPIAEAIAGDWRRKLGFEAVTEFRASGSLLEMNEHRQIPIYLTGWSGDYPDPENFVRSIFFSTSDANRSGFDDVEVDRLIDQADESQDSKRRVDLYAEAERRGLKSCYIIPLFHQSELFLVSKRVTGYHRGPFGIGSLWKTSRR